MTSNVVAIELERMAGSIATNYGDKGGVVITVGPTGFRIGMSGLTAREVQDALCVGIHHNLLQIGEDS